MHIYQEFLHNSEQKRIPIVLELNSSVYIKSHWYGLLTIVNPRLRISVEIQSAMPNRKSKYELFIS